MPTKKADHTFRTLPIAITLGESAGETTIPNRVQLLKVGTFFHPEYGKFEITPDLLLKLKENFDAKVRGVDIAIDFAHESEGEAAAWIKTLSIEGSDLWAEVDWTNAGKAKVAGKEFRYLSADFAQNFKSNETLKAFGPTLMGAGLTNRPVIKGMAPVFELSEFNQNQGVTMDPKDKQIAELQAKIAEMQKAKEGDDMAMADLKKQLAELQAANVAAAEEKKCAEKKGKFDKMLSEGKVCEAQREAFMKDDMAKFTELAQPVKLSEGGHANNNKTATGEKAASDEVIELAEKRAKETNTTFAHAIGVVLSENPELRKRYEKETSVR